MINPFGSHLLNVIAYLPARSAGLLILVGFRSDQKKAVARYATLIAGIDFLISLVLWFDWSLVSPWDLYGMRFVQRKGLDRRHRGAVSGRSRRNLDADGPLDHAARVHRHPLRLERGPECGSRSFYACLLFLQTGMIGVFISLDMFLFYVFWEVMLIPMYFIIGVWGGKRGESTPP